MAAWSLENAHQGCYANIPQSEIDGCMESYPPMIQRRSFDILQVERTLSPVRQSSTYYYSATTIRFQSKNDPSGYDVPVHGSQPIKP